MDELYKRLSEIPQKKRPLVAIGVLIASVVGWYFLSIRPLKLEIINSGEQIQRIERELSQRPATLARIADLDRDIESQRNRRVRLSEQLPSEDDIADLLNKIHDRARESGFNLTRFERGSTILEELYARIEVKVEFTGTFKQVLRFINELGDVKELDRIINVEQLTVTRVHDEKRSYLRGSFLLVTFRSKTNLVAQQGGQP
jgi:Tfp pilus assembly protein PilO